MIILPGSDKLIWQNSYRVISIIFIGLLYFQSTFAQSSKKITPELQVAIHKAEANLQLKAWVFFADKGGEMANRLIAAETYFTTKSHQRRLRNRNQNKLVDEFDIPVNKIYFDLVAGKVSHIRHRSRWLNAVSVEAVAAELTEVASLQCVNKIDLVQSSSRKPVPAETRISPIFKTDNRQHSIDYGPSLTQNQMIRVPELHDLGYDGSGVLICMMDAGFNILEHEALDHINIVAARDFVNNDNNVDDEPDQMGSGSHGSQTLSTIAGFEPGKLIGPAYGADFLLAKTENTDSELHIEEDNWVAAAEWADSLGADIISSSLGYLNQFSDGSDYSWQDMNGKTTIVTIGAEIAASRGIFVVNSAGNSGTAPSGQNSLGAPSDGANVFCIGAVDADGKRAGFSSVGPTADGRTKPDVMAMGVKVYLVSTFSRTGYTTSNGTSFSCPLVAGVAALLLQINPDLSIVTLMDALRNSADNAAAPNNLLGWGIIDAVAAKSIVTAPPQTEPQFTLYPAYPNPFKHRTFIRFDLSAKMDVSLTLYNSRGQKVLTLLNSQRSAGPNSVTWNGKNSAGQTVSSGVYYYRLRMGDLAKSRSLLFLR